MLPYFCREKRFAASSASLKTKEVVW